MFIHTDSRAEHVFARSISCSDEALLLISRMIFWRLYSARSLHAKVWKYNEKLSTKINLLVS